VSTKCIYTCNLCEQEETPKNKLHGVYFGDKGFVLKHKEFRELRNHICQNCLESAYIAYKAVTPPVVSHRGD
jgi:hypothetical protein